jgi:hypothetical protein
MFTRLNGRIVRYRENDVAQWFLDQQLGLRAVSRGGGVRMVHAVGQE